MIFSTLLLPPSFALLNRLRPALRMLSEPFHSSASAGLSQEPFDASSFDAYINRVKPEHSTILPVSECASPPNILARWIAVDTDKSSHLHQPSGRSYLEEKSWAFKCPLAMTTGMCLYRWKLWWILPKLLPSSDAALPAETILLLGRTGNGAYVLLLPVVDVAYSFALETLGGVLQVNGHYVGNAQSALAQPLESAVIVATGPHPYELIHHAMRIAKQHTRALNSFLVGSAFRLTHPPRKYKHIGPTFARSLGWCTWDAFYTSVNAEKVLRALSQFNEQGIQIKSLILDDGWQNTSVNDAANGMQWSGKLSSFGPKASFTGSALAQDFKLFISKVKAEHGVSTLLVWHAMAGYWRGVDSSSSSLQRFRSTQSLVRISSAEARISVKTTEMYSTVDSTVELIPSDRIGEFYQEYHEALSACGVDGVKVDAQAMIPSFACEAIGGGIHLASSYHAALQASVLRWFGTPADHTSGQQFPLIHCMCHAQSTLLAIAAMYPDARDDGATDELMPIVRGSDDFWPSRAASHGPHLFANALNSLLITEMGVHDWDMFQTNKGAVSLMHAAARALSGGPVYTSDNPTNMDPNMYAKIAFPGGEVPRSVRNARPVIRCLFDDPQRSAGVPLLLQNRNADGFVVGVFSIAGAVVENEADDFRALRVDEMHWPGTSSPTDVNTADVPVWMVESLLPLLRIDTRVFLRDAEELHPASTTTVDCKDDYVAYRYSDGAVIGAFELGDPDASVAVHLEAVFAFDVVSFARVHRLSTSGSWIAALGVLSMLNPGGAVLATSINDALTELAVDVLGAGEVSFVSDAEPAHVNVVALDETGELLENTATTASVSTKHIQMLRPTKGSIPAEESSSQSAQVAHTTVAIASDRTRSPQISRIMIRLK